ncbi:hypothetical protein ACFLZV_01780 [Candidatus Margulisiibacteriota bacterium]
MACSHNSFLNNDNDQIIIIIETNVSLIQNNIETKDFKSGEDFEICYQLENASDKVQYWHMPTPGDFFCYAIYEGHLSKENFENAGPLWINLKEGIAYKFTSSPLQIIVEGSLKINQNITDNIVFPNDFVSSDNKSTLQTLAPGNYTLAIGHYIKFENQNLEIKAINFTIIP